MKNYANSIEELYELYDKGLLSRDSFSIVLPANGVTLSALKEYHVKDPIWCINPSAKATLSTLYNMLYRGEFKPSIVHTLKKLNIVYVIVLKDIPFIGIGKHWNWHRVHGFFGNTCKPVYEDQYLAVFNISDNYDEKPYNLHIDDLTQTVQIRVKDARPLEIVLPLEIHDEITIVKKSCDVSVPPISLEDYPSGFLTLYIKPVGKNCEVIVRYNPLEYRVIYTLVLGAEAVIVLIVLKYLISLGR